MLSKEEFLATSADVKLRPVDVHGKTVHLQEWKESEIGKYMGWMKPKGEFHEGRAADANSKLIVETVCDETGRKLFSDRDIPMLRDQPRWWTAPIIKECLKAAGLDDDPLADGVALKKKSSSSADATGDIST